jgi:hypothetical protein
VKVGDLVRLLDDPDVRRNNGEISPDAIGVVVEDHLGDPLASMWVQWSGRCDWDSMFVEDLEILSEAGNFS